MHSSWPATGPGHPVAPARPRCHRLGVGPASAVAVVAAGLRSRAGAVFLAPPELLIPPCACLPRTAPSWRAPCPARTPWQHPSTTARNGDRRRAGDGRGCRRRAGLSARLARGPRARAGPPGTSPTRTTPGCETATPQRRRRLVTPEQRRPSCQRRMMSSQKRSRAGRSRDLASHSHRLTRCRPPLPDAPEDDDAAPSSSAGLLAVVAAVAATLVVVSTTSPRLLGQTASGLNRLQAQCRPASAA